LIAACAAMVFIAKLPAVEPEAARQIPVPSPPLGWSSWNSFSNTVDAQVVMEQAKAMAANGMQKAGYQYINIDEGWWLGKRDDAGNIVVDEKAWPPLAAGEKPGDMANIVRFIHGLGLKAGIYTDAGRDGCSLYPDLGTMYFNTGSEGHYEQDFLQFARWGFDYVKVDWCGGARENLDPAVQYAEIARAIARAEKATGHRLYFSICEWGVQSPWTWAANVGGVEADIWRTSGDIVDPIVAGGKNSARKAGFEKMLGNFDQGIHPEAQHTGFYNDPDMMVIGMPGFSDAQNRVHMSLWAISGAPLLVGADLAKLSPETLAMLVNPAVLAVDQDALGLQAVKVAEPAKGQEIWVKSLAKPGSRAVLLLNRTAAVQEIAAGWKDLGLALGSKATIRNVWTGEELSNSDSLSARVPAGDAVFMVVQGTESPAKTYQPERAQKSGPKTQTICRGCDLRFGHVGSNAPWAQVRIRYTNPDKASRFAELRVNGRIATRIGFPPTGLNPGVITIQALLDRQGETNTLTFSEERDPGPAIDSIGVK
jgi:Alpha galactosidase A/Alpha galactosidase C-terminal beta sandwich domain